MCLCEQFMQRKKHTEADRRAALQARKRQDEWVDEQPAAEDECVAGWGFRPWRLLPLELAGVADGELVGRRSAIVCVADVADPSLPLVFGRRSFGGFNKGVEVRI